ncbi:hypothetical protein BK126_26120 [Paenibacillus sp. FSL H7-0326]|uniref:hypothetical protein n=1 Tax=Paenibacillus sp. FSL H7-0326 TaxID=1921144 RepID=UPI00096DD4FB|nr:hypothetical protein [Paenibacillus sp. FSL H7-0326]OMC63673.1 hypothetical protein BK126_26120 [Paenibacillus sp. FSL H7-0326]
MKYNPMIINMYTGSKYENMRREMTYFEIKGVERQLDEWLDDPLSVSESSKYTRGYLFLAEFKLPEHDNLTDEIQNNYIIERVFMYGQEDLIAILADSNDQKSQIYIRLV